MFKVGQLLVVSTQKYLLEEKMKKIYRFSLICGLIYLFFSPFLTYATQPYKQQGLIDQATVTFQNFVNDPNMTWFRQHLPNCKGILIVPQLLKGAFIIGAEGGTGVLLARDQFTGKWSQPVFYTLASVSFGLQAGAQSAEVILMIMTNKGMDALLSTSIKLGADVSIAAGPYGAGAKAETVDVLAFSKSKGLFGGISIEGALITPKNDWNIAYYKKNVRPVDIIVRKAAYNPYSSKLIKVVEKACAIRKPVAKPLQPQSSQVNSK